MTEPKKGEKIDKTAYLVVTNNSQVGEIFTTNVKDFSTRTRTMELHPCTISDVQSEEEQLEAGGQTRNEISFVSALFPTTERSSRIFFNSLMMVPHLLPRGAREFFLNCLGHFCRGLEPASE